MCAGRKCKSKTPCMACMIGKPSQKKMARRKSKFSNSKTLERGFAVGTGLVVASVAAPKMVDLIPEDLQDNADIIVAGITGAVGYYLAEQNKSGSFAADAGFGMIGGSVLRLAQKYAGIASPGGYVGPMAQYSASVYNSTSKKQNGAAVI